MGTRSRTSEWQDATGRLSTGPRHSPPSPTVLLASQPICVSPKMSEGPAPASPECVECSQCSDADCGYEPTGRVGPGGYSPEEPDTCRAFKCFGFCSYGLDCEYDHPRECELPLKDVATLMEELIQMGAEHAEGLYVCRLCNRQVCMDAVHLTPCNFQLPHTPPSFVQATLGLAGQMGQSVPRLRRVILDE